VEEKRKTKKSSITRRKGISFSSGASRPQQSCFGSETERFAEFFLDNIRSLCDFFGGSERKRRKRVSERDRDEGEGKKIPSNLIEENRSVVLWISRDSD
jgi:hypothetical protein